LRPSQDSNLVREASSLKVTDRVNLPVSSRCR